MRSPGGTRRHDVKAADAASTAAPTSRADDNGTAAIASPVAGLRTGCVSVAIAAVHRPPTWLSKIP
jgi:hypothetical protein